MPLSPHPPEYIYRSGRPDPIPVGREIAHGGEGVICLLPTLPGTVLKYYHTICLPDLPRRIDAIIRRRVPTSLDGILVACLPEETALDRQGHFLGYLMPRLDTRLCLHDLWLDQNRFFQDISMRARLAIAYNLAEAVAHLHAYGLVVGDLNPKNVALRTDGTVALYDLGGCTVTGQTCRGGVGMADYLAPELLTGSLDQVVFTAASDDFALAILLFQIILEGCHPFNTPHLILDSALSTDIITDLTADILGGSPYVTAVPNRAVPPYAQRLLPRLDPLLPLFTRAFGYSSSSARSPHTIAGRPDAETWKEALLQYYREVAPVESGAQNRR